MPRRPAAPEPAAAPAAAPAPASAPVPAEGQEGAAGRPHRLTPRARRLAREHGIPYEAVGGGGRAGDVLALVASGGPRPAGAAAVPVAGNGAPAPGGYRDLIARKVTEAWQTIPHFSVTREIDADELLAFASWSKREGLPVTVTDLLLISLAKAVATPEQPAPAIGLAVATERGVLIPVISDVAQLGLAALAAERAQAVERARSGRLAASDLSAAPVSTLSNLGSFGVDQFTGVIAAGQATLLTVGRIRDRVVVRGRALEARPTLFATLNVDHRALDGSDAAQLLDRFAAAVERPESWERSRD